MKALVGKVMWMGRATVFLVGFAVILAAVMGVASMALAANGKPFILGKNNVATKISKLVKSGAGPALDLRVDSGPPLRVNSDAQVPNLNADKVDGMDSGAFLASGGTAADSEMLDGADSSDFVKRGSSGTATESPLNFQSYFMSTSQTQDFPFGQIKLQTNGTAGQFRVCEDIDATNGTFNFVVYVNGTRTSGSFPVNNGCSQFFDAGAGGDFQVSGRQAQIFGIHSGDGTSNENYSLIGFSRL